MKKRVSVVGIFLLMLALLCGCSKMTPQTVDGVKDYLVQNGYYDEKYYASFQLDGVSSCADFLTNKWSLLFYDYGDRKEDFETIYEPTVEELAVTRVVTTVVKKSNYTVSEVYSDTNYGLIVRVDNTMLYVTGPKEDMYEIRDLVEGLGYYKE